MKDPREILVEQVAGACRARDPEGALREHPAWHDLDAAGRQDAFELAVAWRALEAAVDPEGLSATARSVMRRIGA